MSKNSIEVDAPRIIHRDEHFLGVYKPAGVPSQKDPSRAPTIGELVGAELIDPPHRLDRPVSGVMLLARTMEAMKRSTALFRECRVTKVYLAVVEGHFTECSVLRHNLQHDPRSRKARVVQGGDQERQSVLNVDPVRQGDRYTLVEVRPEGGRFHQIRAQLAAAGHPVHGDVKYGARRPARMPGIALHALELTLPHPFAERPMVLRCEPPAHGIWKVMGASGQ